MVRKFDFLVIGSGIAGMSFALKVAHKGKVALICKSGLEEANTYFAQGGVASVTNLLVDNFDKHIEDTMIAGDWISNRAAVEKVVREAPAQIEELIKRNEEKQKSLRVAEVKALSLQVNPHFLYNTLDMIKWSVKLDQKEKANQIIVQFGRLLRQLMNTTEDFLPLEDELKLVNAYLSIQMLRHQGRFKVETDIEPDLLPVMIPKLMLQPLVENAIIHGLESKASDGKLIIRVRSEGENYVCLTVADNGQGMDEKQLETVRALVPDGIYHIGLSNLHQRAKLFGDEHCGLTIKSKVMQGTEISLIIKRTENQGGEYHRDV